MAVCFRETRETINLLRRVVDKLDESNGYISAEELWDGVQCVPANVWSPDFTVARHGMRQMEGFSNVLQSFMSTLVSTYKTHTSTTRRNHIPQLTINSLPSEIIHHIVKDAFDYTKPIWLVRYSHVSSKIRNNILDSPSLWASIPLTIDIPSWLIKAIISRSAAFMLTVDIEIRGREPFSSRVTRSLSSTSVVSRLSTMLEHHQRWKELTLSIANQPGKLILQNFPSVYLTSVRVLHVDYGEMGADFFQKWKTPPLEKLHWRNISSFPPISMATQTLRICTLRLQTSNSNVLSTTAFLNVATSLQSLKLELEPWAGSAPTELPEIRLSCLEHLGIKSRLGDGPTANRLLKSILCPGLKSLTISASTHAEYSDLTENMRERYPMLTVFTLAAADGVFFFDDIMCPLPNTIKDVKIALISNASVLCASRRDDFIPQNFVIFFPNLTDLDLEWCTIQGEGFYDKLSEILMSFRVSLDHFRPARLIMLEKAIVELDAKNAIITLQRAGVLTV